MGATEARSPEIAIVVATYNRSRALACALESARRQTFEAWEMIVVGDACTDDTADVVARTGDSRIRFANLTRSCGEQAGPSNFGIASSTAPLVAFLNHDDVWLPDHLRLCREALLTEPADFVFGTAANIQRESPYPLRLENINLAFDGLGAGHRYSPAELDRGFVPASCWLVKREVLTRLGGWRPARRRLIAPSQDLLFRAWRAGYRLYALNQLTLVIASSGTRAGSYLGNEAPEQEWVLSHLDDPAFATELAAQMGETNAAFAARLPARRPRWKRAAAILFAALGVHPLRLVALRRGLRRGDLITQLRRVRGLPVFDPPADAATALRFDMVKRACRVDVGTTIDFAAGRGGARFLASGWSRPEAIGVWNDGRAAQLLFDFGRPPLVDLVFELSLLAWLPPASPSRTVEVVVGEGSRQETWTLTPEDSARRQVRVAAGAARGAHVGLTFRFPDAVSPRSLGISDDPRQLAMALVRLRIDAAGD